ncbi:hypothetical protein ACREYP_08850 [Enterobacter sp. TMH.L2]
MNKQLEALIAKIKKQAESFDTVVLKEDEAKALIAAIDLTLQYVKQRDEDNQYLMRLHNEREHMQTIPSAVKLPAEGTDYKSLVMQLAEIVHGGQVDIGRLPVTIRSIQQLCAAPQMPGWISVDEELPDPNSNKRVCAYTPSEYGDFQYRSVPASLFKSVCRQATHWHYFTVPGNAIAAAPKLESAVKK